MGANYLSAKASVTAAISALAAIIIISLPAPAAPWQGTGTAEEPYWVTDANDLQAVGADPNYWDATFKLTTDIDLNKFTGTDFNIIGRYYAHDDPNNLSFSGLFDGDGYTIRNFTYDCNDANGVGLFRYIGRNAVLRSLVLDGAIVNAGSGDKIGILVGISEGIVSDCCITGSVVGENHVGGLVGWNYMGEISGCWSSGSVSATDYVGGLVGHNSAGTISCCCVNSTVSGDARAGGLLGYNRYALVSDCYAEGQVQGRNFVGGLVGDNWQGTILTSYTNALVTGDNHVGGLMGAGEGTANCFWDTVTSGQSESSGGHGVTTEQMQNPGTFIGWNQPGRLTWKLDEGNGYPKLWWENAPGEPLPVHQISDFLRGTGTGEDPHLIYTAEELNTIGLFPYDWIRDFRLMGDISLAAFKKNEFNIIAPGTKKSFAGVFNGNGHAIRYFTYTETAGTSVGLFGRLASDGEIRNLSLEDVYIDLDYGYTVGALVGWNHGVISNCRITGVVIARSNVGGIVGQNSYSGVISCCSLTASVGGSRCFWRAGGLAGTNNGTISDCYAQGTFTGNKKVGGITGQNEDGGTITRCYVSGTVDGTDFRGGLVGYNQQGMIKDSLWSRQVGGDFAMCGHDDTNECDNLNGMTSSEMRRASTFLAAGWDFVGETDNGTEDIWRICVDGVDYPRLWWEFENGDFGCPDGVDFVDFAEFGEHWLAGPCVGQCVRVDITGDGIVDVDDLAAFVGNWLRGF